MTDNGGAQGPTATPTPTYVYPLSAPPMSAVPGYGYPYYYAYPPMIAPARQTPTWVHWLLRGISIAMIVLSVASGGLFALADSQGAFSPGAVWQTGAVVINPPPAANASAAEWELWARRSVIDALKAQTTALLSGNEDGFIASIDPDNAKLVDSERLRYANLHAMGPGVWSQQIDGTVRQTTQYRWKVDIKTNYCFGDTTCVQAPLYAGSTWKLLGNRIVMTAHENTSRRYDGPRPWEVDELKVKTGPRVVVATTKAAQGRLDAAFAAAERAAKIADAFAKWEQPPSRYVIFVGNPEQSDTWYGGSGSDYAAAWAIPLTNVVWEIVVRSDIREKDLPVFLAHELTHVSSLSGKNDGRDEISWWLKEGLADYAAMHQLPVIDYDKFIATREFVEREWDGEPAVRRPSSDASLLDANGRYGVAYLTVRRISEVYGQDKMLDFFGRVVHDGNSLEAASSGALHTAWSKVRADCARYVRTAVQA